MMWDKIFSSHTTIEISLGRVGRFGGVDMLKCCDRDANDDERVYNTEFLPF